MVSSDAAKQDLYRKYVSGLGGDGPARNLPYLRSLLTRFVPKDRTCRILEIGCGRGSFLKLLENAGYKDLSGVDSSPSQVAAREWKNVELGDGLEVLRNREGSSVDLLVMLDVLEHLTREELLNWSVEAFRVLTTGGKWLIHVPNAAGIFGSRVRYADLTHECAFTADSLYQLARRAGFTSVLVSEDKPIVHGFMSGCRRVVWEVGRLPFVLMWLAETGSLTGACFTQNLTAVFERDSNSKSTQ